MITLGNEMSVSNTQERLPDDELQGKGLQCVYYERERFAVSLILRNSRKNRRQLWEDGNEEEEKQFSINSQSER